jgi:hypothetical protein
MSASSWCCTGDGSRPPEAGLQELASNRPVPLCSKGMVVSNWGKGIARCQVRIEKMSESEPSMTHRYCLKVLSKPELTIGSGSSRDGTCLRSRRQSVYRRHQLNAGFGMERENLVADAKKNNKWQKP